MALSWIDGLMHMYVHSYIVCSREKNRSGDSVVWQLGNGASEMLRFAIKVFRLEI